MSEPSSDATPLSGSVLAVGCGGLGSPALDVLARSGVSRFRLLDDDVVDVSNLHRQTLYDDADAGRPKAEVAAERLRALAPNAAVTAFQERLSPANALSHVRGQAVVLEGADNFASKFLAADAAHLSGVPIVQAGAVRWTGWALAQVPGESACLRCVFEDIPRGEPETCAVAGVIGPVVGVLGAIEAALALRLLAGDKQCAGTLWSYDGLRGRLRRFAVHRRSDCPLCRGDIHDLNLARYVTDCAA